MNQIVRGPVKPWSETNIQAEEVMFRVALMGTIRHPLQRKLKSMAEKRNESREEGDVYDLTHRYTST